MRFEGISHVGKLREKNEDFYYASNCPNFPLFIVADGIGGRNYGEIASQVAVNYIKDQLLPIDKYQSLDQLEEDFVKVLTQVNNLVYEMSLREDKYRGMGTTLTLAYIYNKYVLIGNIGDSRVYVVGKSYIRQLTVDDTYVNKLIELGEITKDQAKDHPRRNVITNAVGTDVDIDINIIQYDFADDEYLLMCTDGLSDMVKDEDIKEIFNQGTSLEEIKDNLLQNALEAGGKDNITFIIIEM